MSESESNTGRQATAWGKRAALVVVLVLLLAAAFMAGRSTATPKTVTETVTDTVTETITETVEVTRQVTVEAQAQEQEAAQVETGSEPAAAGQPVDQPDGGAAGEDSAAVESAAAPASESGSVADLDLDLFYEVWKIVEDNYDGDLPVDDELLYAAISGSLETLADRNTRFVPPDVAARMREDIGGSVEGIGAFVRENEDGFFEVVRPIDGQPAEAAGLKAGDIITGVDGESVLDASFDEVILLVRGPEGTTVTLTIAREGVEEPIELTIVRARFEVPTVEAKLLPENIAYVRVTSFTGNSDRTVQAALDELLPQNPVGIILDLRDNGGGLVDESVEIADMLLPAGVVLYQRNSRGQDDAFNAEDGDPAESLPLVVLVNAASASASEIVAGAVQDSDRGILIGETTFGKGSVQRVFPLQNGSDLRVTVARWYTPLSNSIEGEGITPDIFVETPEDLGSDEDAQLQRAVEYILTGQ